jgi:ATP-binding cassette, subfamily F, member 3
MSLDIGDEIRSVFPDTDETIVDYVSGYVEYAVEDDTGEDVVGVVRELLESFARGHELALDALLAKLENYLEEVMNSKPKSKGPKLTRLDRVLDMSKTAMSNTITLTEGVDLESINKSKCVPVTLSSALNLMSFLERLELTSKN